MTAARPRRHLDRATAGRRSAAVCGTLEQHGQRRARAQVRCLSLHHNRMPAAKQVLLNGLSSSAVSRKRSTCVLRGTTVRGTSVAEETTINVAALSKQATMPDNCANKPETS